MSSFHDGSRKNIRWKVVCCLQIFVFVIWFGISLGYAMVFSGYDVARVSQDSRLKDSLVLNPSRVFLVNHDPEGPTLNHDYYERNTNKEIKQLVRLVEGAHVRKIMPNLKQSFTAPDTLRKGFLQQALQEIDYTLGRLVNHPKALALSATVTKLLGRPSMPITYYQRALKMYPRRAFTQAQFGNFLVEYGEIDQGIERLNIAISLNPKLAMSYGWIAWAHHKNGDNELAAEFSQKARKRGFKGKLPAMPSKK